MKFLMIPIAAASLALSGAAFGQQSQPSTPPSAQQQQAQARQQAVSTYAQVLFAKNVEKRCKHLDDGKRTELNENVDAIDSYMKENLSKETVDMVQKQAAKAGADEERNPCGDASQNFVEQSAVMIAQLSDSLEQNAP